MFVFVGTVAKSRLLRRYLYDLQNVPFEDIKIILRSWAIEKQMSRVFQALV